MVKTVKTADRLQYHVGDIYPLISATIKRGGEARSLVGATGASFVLYPKGAESGAPKETLPLTILNAEGGKVTGTPTATLFDTAGEYSAVIVIDWGGAPETVPDHGYIPVVVHSKGS